MTSSQNDEFRDSFFEECEELLEVLQDGLDQLSVDPKSAEVTNAIFRAVHSIKGGAGAFGLDNLVAYTHHFENGLDNLRSGKVEPVPDLLQLTRQCADHLADLVELARADGASSQGDTATFIEMITKGFGVIDDGRAEETETFEPLALTLNFENENDLVEETSSNSQEFDIRFLADPGIFSSGNEPLLLFRALEKLGDVTISAELDEVPTLCDLEPTICHMAWNIFLATNVSEAEIREVFDFVEGDCQLDVTPRTEIVNPAAANDVPSLSDFVRLNGNSANQDTRESQARDVVADFPKTNDLGDARNVKALSEHTRAGKSLPQNTQKPTATIRVDFEKIDKLINLVGELVIKEAMLSQSVGELKLSSESEVSVGLESLKQLAGEIQEGVMAIRAQPVKPMFQRMSRIVREASLNTGKPVRFETRGEYTEVDKTVIERLIDPLTHMIRNAIDHGLEDAQSRKNSLKPEEGTITLSAAHRSGRVIIDVSDDGGGINREKVRQIAIERGLVAQNVELTEGEIDNFLFSPGFSSKEEISELSGRGVGLDVVRSEITGLGGRVSIKSNSGEGTTFTISLPLTLAVLEGMIIEIANQTMVVPISTIQETVRPRSSEIETIGAAERLLHNRDGVLPIIDLGHFFGFRPFPTDLTQHVLLLIETAKGECFSLVVDEIQDQRQVVIKSLETNYQQIPGVAAATILGDGRIALIIDPENIAGDVGQPGSTEFTLSKAG